MTTSSSPLVLARRSTALVFALFGFVLGIWVVYIPTIRDRTGASFHELGIALLLLGAGSFVAMTLCSHVINHVGSRAVTVTGACGVSILAIGPSVCSSPVELAVATTALGFASGLHDVGQNAQAVEVERRHGRPIMASFHAIYSLGGLAAAAVSALTLHLDIDPRAVFVVAAALGLLLTAWCAPRLVSTSSGEHGPAKQLPAQWNRRVLLIGSIAFAFLLAEGVAYDWSTIHLRDVLHAEKSVAPLAFAAFTVTMVGMRLVADRIVERVGAVTFIRVGTGIGVAGLAIAAASPVIGWAVVGWGLFGLGLAGCVPLTFTSAGAIDPARSDALVSRVSSLGYLGLLAGPSIIGFLAPVLTLRGALLVPIVCCVYAGLASGRAFAGPTSTSTR